MLICIRFNIICHIHSYTFCPEIRLRHYLCIPQVMLVSLCAGGVGINLTGGNHLFLIDMHW